MTSSTKASRPWALAVVAVLVACLLAACGSGSGAGGNGGSAQSVTVGTLNFPTSLDPTVSASGYDYPYLNLIFETLLKSDPTTGALEPGLAEKWSVSSDGKQITFNLRPGVKFQDGTVVNASAVKASLDRFKASANGTDIAHVASVEAQGTDVVVLKLSEPDSSVLSALTDRAGMIVSPTAAEKLGKDFASKPVGAGPYSFTSSQTGASVTFGRFADYWNGEPKNPTLTWKIYQDPQAMITALQSKAVDVVIGIPATYAKKLQSDSALKVVVGPAYSETMINFNAGLAPTNSEQIRQAINYALDRDAINTAGSDDVAKVTWTALPPTHPYYDETMGPTYPRDVEKAKQLVSEATGGKRVSMKCLTFPGLNYETTGPIIVSELKEIGIDVTIESETAPAATEDFWAKAKAPCFLSGWTGHEDPAITYGRLLNKDSYYNAGKVDFGTAALQAKLLTTYDFDERKAVATEIAQKVAQVAPFAPLFTVPQIVGLSKDVAGYEPNASGRPDLSTVYRK